jgi:hypothetical protein
MVKKRGNFQAEKTGVNYSVQEGEYPISVVHRSLWRLYPI